MEMKKVLIIDGSGDYSFSMSRSLSYCVEYELHLLALASDKLSPGLKYANCHYVDGYSDAERWIEAIEAIVKQYAIDLIIAGSESAIEFLILHQQRLSLFVNLPELPSKSTFDIAKNKARLSEYISANGLSQPKTFVYRQNVDLAGISELTFPVLLKLPTEGGGAGIQKFKDESSLKEYLLANDFSEDVLCQEFIDGRDICMSVLCKEGEITAYTIQQTLIEAPKLYAPALTVEFLHNENVLSEVSQLMRLLGWQGVAHIDMRLDEKTGQVYVIEINPRFWMSLMASLIAGVNFTWLYCQQMQNLSCKFNGYNFIQVIRAKTLCKCLFGGYKSLSPLRLFSMRTGLSFRLYALRRFMCSPSK